MAKKKKKKILVITNDNSGMDEEDKELTLVELINLLGVADSKYGIYQVAIGVVVPEGEELHLLYPQKSKA